MKKWMLKCSVMLLAAFLLIPGLAGAEESPSFTDVRGTYWAKDAIDSLVSLGVVKGFENHTFKPESPVTREEFAQLITLAFYLDLPTDDAQTYRDVSKSRWSFPAVEASKEFLTGYYPPNGKAFFDPTGKATREDVAVALVKTLGYQPDDLQNPDILDRYNDADDVSPNLSTYLALAVEKKLLTGYEDFTIKPTKAVTRAEAASLLYRVLKSASSESQASLNLNVEAPETTSSPTFYISGDVTKGASVYINNKAAEVVQGQFRVAIQLKDEGTYTYTVTARVPGGKTQTVTKQVKFEKGAPSVVVTGVPEVTDKQSITVAWTIKDDNDPNPIVYVNDQKITYGSSTTVNLKEGDNTVTVKAENRFGKSTVVTKHVVFQTGGPVLKVTDLPATTNKDSVTVSWTVSDPNDYNPEVYVNDQRISYGSSTTVKLKEGTNTLVIKATNKLGKSTIVTKTINFVSSGPVLKVSSIPENTTKNSVTISWSVTDENDYSPIVYVNDQKISYGSSTTLKLKEGQNTVIIKATNKLGQETQESHNITFAPSAPSLKLGYAPETTSSSSITLTWSVSDENDYSPNVFINDQKISYSSSTNLVLKPGVNTFKIVASNSYGKTTELTYTVTYTPAE
ncbi:Endo-1,4-beta-xylanase A precursor [compost metagenome]